MFLCVVVYLDTVGNSQRGYNMWISGRDLDDAQYDEAKSRGYPNVEDLVWYLTADGRISERHKPRQGGLDDKDIKLILTALVYLAHCPHLSMIVDASTEDVVSTIERVQNELHYTHGK